MASGRVRAEEHSPYRPLESVTCHIITATAGTGMNTNDVPGCKALGSAHVPFLQHHLLGEPFLFTLFKLIILSLPLSPQH